MATRDIWTYRDQGFTSDELAGLDVEALDGRIGKVDEATADTAGGFVVINTGPWIFGKKAMLPAGVIENVDREEGVVFVDRTKDEIKEAPQFDESRYLEPAYRDEVAGYYTGGRVGRAFDEPL